MRDRPAGGNKPQKDEMEITPEMIQAGAAVLLDSGYLREGEFLDGGVKSLIQDVLRALMSVRSG